MTLVVRDPQTLGTGALAGRKQVLVTDEGGGHARSAVAAVRAVAAGGYEPVVGVSGPGSLAAASRHARRVVPLPAPDAADYRDQVMAWLAAPGALGVLPTSDPALLALHAPVAHLVDKTVLAGRAAAAGFPPLEQRRFDSTAELLAASADLVYPVVVKPAVSRFPARCVHSRDELARLPVSPDVIIVQPYLFEPLHAVAGVMWDGAVAAIVHQRYLRTWPPEAGTAAAAVTVALPSELEEVIGRLLGGYTGIFQAQLAGDHLLDLNARVYGSLPLAVAAGANLPAVLCDLAAGVAPRRVRGRAGVRYRWIEGDVRHLWWAWRQGRLSATAVLGALRPRQGTAHSVASCTDPGPLLARARHALRKARR